MARAGANMTFKSAATNQPFGATQTPSDLFDTDIKKTEVTETSASTTLRSLASINIY